MKNFLISVCGSDTGDTSLSTSTLNLAESIGELIAQQKGIVICGGKGGVMEAVCKGAKSEGGRTLGILPGHTTLEANQYVDIAIPTGLGHQRNYLVVESGHCIIAIGGRWGTLNEITYGFITHKPIVLVKGSGGVVDMLLNSSSLEKIGGLYAVADSAEAAVTQAFSFIQ